MLPLTHPVPATTSAAILILLAGTRVGLLFSITFSSSFKDKF